MMYCLLDNVPRVATVPLNVIYMLPVVSSEILRLAFSLSELVWTVALYGCKTWTLKAVDKRWIQGFETTVYRQLLRVSWMAHWTNASVLQEVQPQERLLITVQRHKLQYFGHVITARNLCTEILEGRLDGKRRRGRPRQRWRDDIKEWSNRTVAECSRLARDRQQCRLLVHEAISDPQQRGRKQASKQAHS